MSNDKPATPGRMLWRRNIASGKVRETLSELHALAMNPSTPLADLQEKVDLIYKNLEAFMYNTPQGRAARELGSIRERLNMLAFDPAYRASERIGFKIRILRAAGLDTDLDGRPDSQVIAESWATLKRQVEEGLVTLHPLDLEEFHLHLADEGGDADDEDADEVAAWEAMDAERQAAEDEEG